MPENAFEQKTILVTGATGYVGGRLVPVLLKRGYRVRAASRSLNKLQSRFWATDPNIELVTLDAFDPASVRAAMRGCDVMYYFIHSMVPGQKNFADADRVVAENVRDAATEEGLKRIIYLSGLGDENSALSKHLKSRREVEHILIKGSVPTTVFRAAMIIGSGSASFEILRYLVERLPVMITPKWLTTPNQPIAIRNVIEYLVKCLEVEETSGKVFDIGGSQVVTYHDLMQIFAEERKLPKRIVIRVPVLTPRLSSYWIHIVTPVPASIARPLAEGLQNPVVCREESIKSLISQDLLSPRKAIRYALARLEECDVTSHWTDSGKLPVEKAIEGDPEWAGGTVFKDERSKIVHTSAESVWCVIRKIGGETGWYHSDWLWHLRGGIDRWVGGVGLRRGRRDPENIRTGDALDFWRVLDVQENKRLLLTAEMKLPGKALLEFFIESKDDKTVALHQIARYRPRGLFGIIYWYLVLPFHHYIFEGMLNAIIQKAESKS